MISCTECRSRHSLPAVAIPDFIYLLSRVLLLDPCYFCCPHATVLQNVRRRSFPAIKRQRRNQIQRHKRKR